MSRNSKILLPRQFWLTIGLALINLALIFIFDGISRSDDTISYEAAIYYVHTQGYDLLRTPGYPLLIALFQNISGVPLYYYGVVAVQAVVFMFSVAVMWLLLKDMTHSKTVATVFGIYYSIAPGIGTYTAVILTESLSISFTVFFIASAYALIKGKLRIWSIIGLFLSLVVLMLLRPSAMSMFVAAAILVAALYANRSALRWIVAAIVVLALAVPLFQIVKVSNEIGVRTASTVSFTNRFNIIKRARIDFTPESTDNPALKARIINYSKYHKLNSYGEIYQMNLQCGYPAVDSMLKYYNSPVVGLGERIQRACTRYGLTTGYKYYSEPGTYSPTIGEKTFFSSFRYWLVPVALVLGCVILVLQWRRDRRFPWFTLFLLSILGAISFTAILYAPDDFTRLSAPGIPALILLFAIPFGKEILIPPYPDNNITY